METLERVEVFETADETSGNSRNEDWTESEWFHTWLELARGRNEQGSED